MEEWKPSVVSIVSYSRLSPMIIELASLFHIYLPCVGSMSVLIIVEAFSVITNLRVDLRSNLYLLECSGISDLVSSSG